MAKAQVTLKLSVAELALIKEALRMFNYAWRSSTQVPNPNLEGYRYDLSMASNIPIRGQTMAGQILRDIEAKEG